MAAAAIKGDGTSPDAIFDSPPIRRAQYAPDMPVYPAGPTGPASFVANPAYNPTAPLPAPPSKYKLVHAAVTNVLGDCVHPIVKKAVSSTGYELDYSPPSIPIDYVLQPEQLALTRSACSGDRQQQRHTDWSVLAP